MNVYDQENTEGHAPTLGKNRRLVVDELVEFKK